MMSEMMIACALVIVPAVLAGATAVDEEWGYHGEAAPLEWCHLAKEFAACCEGDSQSPIDIITCKADQTQLPRLRFRYYRHDFDLLNNGHTVQATVASGQPRLSVRGTTYRLLQFHFHTPSEHWLDGEQFPIEMHLVHQSNDGDLLVVGVFIREGDENPELQRIWDVLPEQEGKKASVDHLVLRRLLPPTPPFWRESFRYDGSLTTPPCTEGVQWIVLAKPIEMSPEQIEQLANVFSGEDFPEGNRRPVQVLNGRDVVTDSH